MVIRKYTEEDRPKIDALLALCEMDELPKQLGGTAFLIEEGEQTIAFAWALIANDSEVALVEYICVHPDYENKGVGIILMADFAQHLLSLGKKTVVGIVTENQPRLVKYYHKVGFAPKARFVMKGDLRRAQMKMYDKDRLQRIKERRERRAA